MTGDILTHAYPPTSIDHVTPLRYRPSSAPSYLPPVLERLERMVKKRDEAGNRSSVPFVWRNDLPRAGLEMLISAIHYLLM